MKPNIVRPIAICVFRHNGLILAARHYDPIKQQPFYRPLGGSIEFGEYSAATIEREMAEELGAAVVDLRYLGAVENVFTYNGQMGHEIAMVYDGAFADPSLYERDVLEGVEDSGASFQAVWVKLADCLDPSAPPLYPTGLLELLGV
ncbi:NUDIX hydrolase [Promineifilum sp.]|uniref:NUDIX hydrolase n=1 Tax=Promineifilum sp. TaxID=2664178 RepID=UPI0035AF6680